MLKINCLIFRYKKVTTLRIVLLVFFVNFKIVAQSNVHQGHQQSVDFIINSEQMNASYKKVLELKKNQEYLSQDEAQDQLLSKAYNKIEVKDVNVNETQLNGAEVYSKILPSTVVFITVGIRASGYIIDEDGICVTNYHVIQQYANKHVNKDGMVVLNSNYEPFMVTEILATDPENDLAIVKIDTRGEKFTPITLGSYLAEGNDVYVLGHPSHVTYYFSEGIVAKNFIRNPKVLNDKERCYMSVTADYGIGSSGAPVVDNKGNLVGTVSTASALYAVPEDNVNPQMVLRNTIPVIALKKLLK